MTAPKKFGPVVGPTSGVSRSPGRRRALGRPARGSAENCTSTSFGATTGAAGTKPSGTSCQRWRMLTVVAATGEASPGDGDAEAVGRLVGLGVGTTVCGTHATATRASAHTHAGYL